VPKHPNNALNRSTPKSRFSNQPIFPLLEECGRNDENRSHGEFAIRGPIRYAIKIARYALIHCRSIESFDLVCLYAIVHHYPKSIWNFQRGTRNMQNQLWFYLDLREASQYNAAVKKSCSPAHVLVAIASQSTAASCGSTWIKISRI
jgi:hypothetical protein